MTGASSRAPYESFATLTGISTKSYTVPVEVCLKDGSPISSEDAIVILHRIIQAYTNWYRTVGVLTLDGVQDELHTQVQQHIEEVRVCFQGDLPDKLFFWQVQPEFQIYRLHRDDPAEDDDVDDGVPGFVEWELPNRAFHGVWDTLIYDTGIKERLLSHSATSLAFSAAGVDQNVIAWNKVALLHGPPGTGKTSLCKALAQKLSVRLRHRFPRGHLIEVNAHSLFSKWFSESGKLVTKLFGKINEFVEDTGAAVFVLIDEVESLTAARRAAVAGSEPSDAIRAVNAMLTHLDALRCHPNVMVLCTSNLPEAVDVAFVDRADIKAYIGPPSEAARYTILRSCILELRRAGIIASTSAMPPTWGLTAAHATAARAAAQVGPAPSSQNVSAAKLPPSAGGIHGSDHMHAPRAASAPAHGLAGMETGDDGARIATGMAAMHEDGCPLLEAKSTGAELGSRQGSQEGAAKQEAPHGEPVSAAQLRQSSLSPGVRQELDALEDASEALTTGSLLGKVAKDCEGLSGRALRKLPFLAVAALGATSQHSGSAILKALADAVAQEVSDRAMLQSD